MVAEEGAERLELFIVEAGEERGCERFGAFRVDQAKNVLGKCQAAVEARCHGLRPGGGSSRRTINPIIAHLIMASLVSGSRS